MGGRGCPWFLSLDPSIYGIYGEAWFPLGCLLFPLFAQSRGQATACVQDNYVSLALCQVSSVQPPAYTLCPHPPEHTAGGAYTLPIGSLEKEPGRSGNPIFFQNRVGLAL